MKLHEIITAVENDQELSYEQIAPFKKSIYAYFKDRFCCEPVVMVTFVCNAIQGVKIVSSNEFAEAIEDYVSGIEDEDDRNAEIETIGFNSKMLSELL